MIETKTSHTPGPWTIEEGKTPVSGGFLVLAPYDEDKLGTPIMATCANIANAHLIAAAPELLQALAFYVQICGNTCYSVTRETAQEMYNQGAAALKKALGQ